MKKIKVMVFGTFDHFHKGHEYFLREAKRLGDSLVVVVARDSTVKKLKGRQPDQSGEERKKAVSDSGIADRVLPGSEKNIYEQIEKERPDVICLGYDQKFFTENLREELDKRGINPRIVRLGSYRPDIYKSSIIKNRK